MIVESFRARLAFLVKAGECPVLGSEGLSAQPPPPGFLAQ